MEDKNGEKTIEKRYYISSLLLDIELFSRAIRSHWSVENKLHWQMDFTFKCDSNTTVEKIWFITKVHKYKMKKETDE